MGRITNFVRIAVILLFTAIPIMGIVWNLHGWQYAEVNSLASFPWETFARELVENLGPELGGIALGVVTLDYLNERRQRHAESFRRNRQLLREFASAVPSVAVKAAEDLMDMGKLNSGLMRDKNFGGANLTGAKLMKGDFTEANFRNAILVAADLEKALLVETTLTGANLDKANLAKCNLQAAELEGASLQKANLRSVNAQKAIFHRTNLRGANLYGANLEGAYLDSANLKGANLEFSFLHNTSLRNAVYDQNTIWPDKFNPKDFGAINKDSKR